MSTLASQIASLTIVNSIIYLSSASLALVRGIHRWAVNSPHKGPVTRKMFPFDDVFMMLIVLFNWMQLQSKYNYFVWNGSICKCQKVSKHNMTFKYPPKYSKVTFSPWWRHQMETFSALMAICAGNSPGTGDWPQRPVTRSFAVFFDVRPNKQLSKQSWRWWFETLSPSLWRHRNDCWVPPGMLQGWSHCGSNPRSWFIIHARLQRAVNLWRHIASGILNNIGSSNGLVPDQAINWTNAYLSSMTYRKKIIEWNFNQNLAVSYKKLHCNVPCDFQNGGHMFTP